MAKAEIRIVHPKTVICMGATAAVGSCYARLGAPLADKMSFVPVHPSFCFRLIDPTDAREQFRMFVRDLRLCRIERRTAGAIAAIEMSLRCLIKSPGSIPIDRVAGATHNQDVVKRRMQAVRQELTQIRTWRAAGSVRNAWMMLASRSLSGDASLEKAVASAT